MDFSLILCGEKNFYRTAIKTDGHFRHNTHKSTLQNEEIRENSAFL